jgi:hypothetical protein
MMGALLRQIMGDLGNLGSLMGQGRGGRRRRLGTGRGGLQLAWIMGV